MGQAERLKGATWFQALWLGSDVLSIFAGFWLGYWVRFHSPLVAWFPPSKGIPPLALYLAGAAVTALLWVPLFQTMGLYDLERGRRRHRGRDLLKGLAFGMALVAALSFFYRGASFSRLAVPFIWGSTALFTLLGRALVERMPSHWAKLRPIHFAAAGHSATSERVVRALLASPYPHRFAGYFTWVSAPAAPPGTDPLGPDLGPVEDLPLVAPRLDLDLILLADSSPSPAQVERLYADCQRLDLDFQFVPDVLSLWGRSLALEEIDGLPVLHLRDLRLSGWHGVLKRAFDLVVSGILLVLSAPLMLLLALWVKLDSKGPVFHRQERVGRDRRPFQMLKFRSMRADAESQSGPVWASEGDPRRTRSGVFLRKWSLDELPQLWNVFRGEMSLVGPRPERAFFVQQFERDVLDYYDRHRVKSGLTGWAQVHGLRGNVPIEDRTRYDLYYVENWSLWLDLRILWMTLSAVFRHRGA